MSSLFGLLARRLMHFFGALFVWPYKNKLVRNFLSSFQIIECLDEAKVIFSRVLDSGDVQKERPVQAVFQA